MEPERNGARQVSKEEEELALREFRAFLQDFRDKQANGLLSAMPTIEERARAQGKEHLLTPGPHHLPPLEFEFDVDEFLKLIEEAPE